MDVKILGVFGNCQFWQSLSVIFEQLLSQHFEFASELKGLRPKDGIDLNALNHYLANGYVPNDLCIAKGVKKLPPAHAGLLNIENGEFNIWKYWNLPNIKVNADTNCDDLADEAWSKLLDSVRLRLRSDVPTGVFL